MTARGKFMDPVLVQPRELYWFVHARSSTLSPLGLMRDDKDGATVVGGIAPEFRDEWWDMLGELWDRGYLPIEVAIARRVVDDYWSPPELSDKDAYQLERIKKGDW